MMSIGRSMLPSSNPPDHLFVLSYLTHTHTHHVFLAHIFSYVLLQPGHDGLLGCPFLTSIAHTEETRTNPDGTPVQQHEKIKIILEIQKNENTR